MYKVITEYKELLQSLGENIQSLFKLCSKSIIHLTEKDTKNTSDMIQIDDHTSLYYEVQLVRTDLAECNSIIDASVFVHNQKISIIISKSI